MPQSSLLMMLSSQLLGSGRFNDGLPSFIMRGLDSEQIWQQLELRNEHRLSLPACTREVVKISSRTHQSKVKDKKQNIKQFATQPVDVGSDGNDSEDSQDSEEDNAMLNSIKKRLAEKSTGDDDDDDNSFNNLSDGDEQDELDFDFQLDNEISKSVSDDEKDDLKSKKAKNKLSDKLVNKRVTVVDDKFFKLADAEQFLDSEDLKEEKKRKKEEKSSKNVVEDDDDDDENDDSEEIDMFGDLDSDDDAQGAKYLDFFDPPDDENVAEGAKEKPRKSRSKTSDLDDSELHPDDRTSAIDMESDGEEEEMSTEQHVNSGDDDEEEEDDDDDDEEEEDNEEEEEEESSKSHVKSKNKKLKESDGGKTDTVSENDKKVTFSSDLLQSDEETDMQHEAKSSINKSTFELRQEQLQAKAREMEEQSLKEVSWELTGEVSSSKRPENSLLDTVLDFQHTAKAAPVITDETTKTLEDYIKQRIKDKTFDDVERKEKPKEDVFEFKKRIVLDQEKSKLSLGELYEQEFVKQQQTETEEVKADPECETIEKELSKLFHQLDALSNFRYTPMRPGTEVKIIVNTPAIAMEEVAPVATADSELLAPEEVHEKKKGDLKAAEEMSSTDKKRARRQKKKDKRERKKAKEAREKVVAKLKPGLGNKYSKVKALKQLEQLSKADRSITVIKGDEKKISSKSFFTQLQDEVQTNAKAKKAVKEKKKKIVDASKFML